MYVCYGMVLIWYDMVCMVWYGMVWYECYGMIWYGIECYMVWYGMVLNVMVLY